MNIEFKRNNKILGVIPKKLIKNESGMIDDLIEYNNVNDEQ